MRPVIIGALASLATLAQMRPVFAQTQEESFRVYSDHPRLLLNSRRLTLLKRERDRQSMRWVQFQTLIEGGAQMPEPGFALALYYVVTGDAATGRRAIEFALTPAADTRQSAFVFDWCNSLLSSSQSKALASKLAAAAAQAGAKDITALRTRALAAAAVADESGDRGAAIFRDIIKSGWRKQIVPAISGGSDFNAGADTLALIELLHVVRDNLGIDLREDEGAYFKQLPRFYVCSQYPAPYPAAENEYRIPLYRGSGQPDLSAAARSRAAGLALVALDTNALENQFLQGWLMQDRFLLRGPLGSPYEFLWANPYQPGLSYAHLPLAFHDARSGALFVRSSWDEDAIWFGLYQGEAQVFRDGRVTVLRQSASASAQTPKVPIGDTATVVLGRSGARFAVDTAKLFVIGLDPRRIYEVEVDDEELAENETDRAGSMEVNMPPEHETAIRIRERNRP